MIYDELAHRLMGCLVQTCFQLRFQLWLKPNVAMFAVRIAVSSAITCCEGHWQHGMSLVTMAGVDRIAPNLISCWIPEDGMG